MGQLDGFTSRFGRTRFPVLAAPLLQGNMRWARFVCCAAALHPPSSSVNGLSWKVSFFS